MNRETQLLRTRLHTIIFEADTKLGKRFDIILLIAILLSVLVVMLDSIGPLRAKYHQLFLTLEWIFTIFFTIEYILRLWVTNKPMKYATSFFGVIDLLAVIPTYISFFIAGSQSLVIIRALRVLRVFRIFKLGSFLIEGQLIAKAMKESRAKITIFLSFILVLVTIFGSIMYLLEGQSNSGFDSIPRSIYWAIVTLTTVGYGDISPVTPMGQALAAFVMMLGYAVIAVPTGIVTAEFSKEYRRRRLHEPISTQVCPDCCQEGHDVNAKFCFSCGAELNPEI